MFFHLSTYDISRSSLSLLFSYLFPFCYASFHSLREAKRRGEERTEELSDEWKESVKGMERRRPGSSILEDSFYLSVSPLFGSLSIRPVCRGSVRFSLFTFPLHSLRSWRMEWGAAEPRVSMSVGVSRLPPSHPRRRRVALTSLAPVSDGNGNNMRE